jgi:S-adenosylmethionine decarboxylase
MIGAHVLNVAKQDYEPQGASVTILISEEEVPDDALDTSCNKGVLVNVPQHVVGHLDKSHLTVHTYPEYHPDNGLSTFRVDIDVSTCGQISPLKALNYLIDSFDSDIITIDYRVRGFTRDASGQKLFIDHNINSIQNYIAKRTLNKYQLIDVNVYQENIFHTKMMLKDFVINNYLFEVSKEDLTQKEQRDITAKLKKEMTEIYYGRNIGKA